MDQASNRVHVKACSNAGGVWGHAPPEKFECPKSISDPF